jgi:hypothetical protein
LYILMFLFLERRWEVKVANWMLANIPHI